MVTAEAINQMLDEVWPRSGSRCAEVTPTSALARMDVRPSMLRPGDLISGPTLFGMADAALWYLVFGVLGRIEPMAVTADLSIRFLRPAQGEVIFARSVLASAGSRTIVGSVTVWTDANEHRPSAAAQGSYVLPRG